MGWGRVEAQDRPQTPEACTGEVIATGGVLGVADGRTLTLRDGREVRLAGIEVPQPAEPPTVGAPERAAREGLVREGLAARVAEAEITIKQAGPQKTDRYGRLIGYAFVTRDGGEHFVQGDLVAAGLARVAAHVGNRACAAELLKSEHDARQAKLGLWGGSGYDLLYADNPTAVLAERGHFVLVEGQVLSVREAGATIYVNFGRRWTEDFTVTILKRNERNFAAAGVEPKKLAGQRIRVRGFVEQRGGPQIEAASPEQIEFAERK